MATVHIGRLLGPVGFARTVAIKRLHPQFAKDPEFVSMFLDEARLAARIRHPNVVPVIDVVASDGELFLVMDFVIGESISRLLRIDSVAREGIPTRIALGLMCGSLQGLHAAHDTKGDKGDALGIVHRDISPQNILLGSDGAARLIDFGIAKAMGRVHASQSGQLKGKLPYMAPEHVRGEATRQSDVFSSGVVLWELVAGKRLFAGETEVETFSNVLQQEIQAPSLVRPARMLGGLEPAAAKKLDEVILRSLERDASKRFATAREFAIALERVVSPASTLETSEWMEHTAGDIIVSRSKKIAEVEELTTGSRAISMATVTDEISKSHAIVPQEHNQVQIRPYSVSPEGTPSESIGPFGRTETSHVTPSNALAPAAPQRSRKKWIVMGLLGASAAATVALASVAFRTQPVATLDADGGKFAAPLLADTVTVAAVPAIEPEPIKTTADAGNVDAGKLRTPTVQRPITRTVPSQPATHKTEPPPQQLKIVNDDCNPAYTMGADGKKHFKPHCFGK
jgi:eukaryotic-like serine/threonine-protein kinase